MIQSKTEDKPAGVYLVSLYFVLVAFLESIQKYRGWGSSFSMNPLTEQSIWSLVTDIAIYLAIAYLVWQLTWLGRLAALVFGYLYLGTFIWFFVLYARGTPMNSTPLFMILAIFHVMALPPLLYYLQKAKRKKLFHVSLLEVLLPGD